MLDIPMVLLLAGAVLGLACAPGADAQSPSAEGTDGSSTSSPGGALNQGAGGLDRNGGGSAPAGGGGTSTSPAAGGHASTSPAAGGHASATPASGGGVGQDGSAGPGAGGLMGSGLCGAQPGQLFGADYPWNQRIDSTALDGESDAIIDYLQKNHTSSARFRIDGPSDEPNSIYGLVVLAADASTAHQAFTPTSDFYSPDCDPVALPVPADAVLEGETGRECTTDGDCHFIVVDTGECRLFEMWRANQTSSSTFEGGCLAVWDLRAPYSPTLRGDCCTSADAAGLPIAAHTFTADEVAAGAIRHAIRFILPNSLIRNRVYVRPATHSTGATTGPAEAPPYGARLRLKASFDESRLSSGARVVARALKEYGMILSDGGNLTFTAANDRSTTHKWPEVELAPGDLTALGWTDFEVPALGTRYRWDDQCDCSRTPVSK